MWYIFLLAEVLVKVTLTSPARHKRSINSFPDDISANFSTDGIDASVHLQKSYDVTDDVPVVLQNSGKMRSFRVDTLEVS